MHNGFTFAGCIQARLGSTRLPRKVLSPIAGKSMIGRIADQVLASRSVKSIVVTTSDAPQDDPLVDWAKEQGFLVFRGPVDDIVTRLWGALRATSCDALIRVWGDCPFVCPDIIDRMAGNMIDDDLDFIQNYEFGKRSIPPGLDVDIYRRELLAKMNREVSDPKQREFPFEFVKNQSGLKTRSFHDARNLSDVHLTVDYPDDLAAAEKLYGALVEEGLPFDYATLIKILEKTSLAGEFSGAPRNIEYRAYLANQLNAKAQS